MAKESTYERILSAYKISRDSVELAERVFFLDNSPGVLSIVPRKEIATGTLTIEVILDNLFQSASEFQDYLIQNNIPYNRTWMEGKAYCSGFGNAQTRFVCRRP